MKRTVSIIISMMCVATTVLFTSCKSDPIVGTWQLESLRICLDGNVVVESSKSDFTSHENFVLRQFEFNKDGAYYTFHPATGEPLNGEWSLLDDGFYSMEAVLADFTDAYLKSRGVEATQNAPATQKARLIDYQTLEMQETMYYDVSFEDEGEKKVKVEIISRFERLK